MVAVVLLGPSFPDAGAVDGPLAFVAGDGDLVACGDGARRARVHGEHWMDVVGLDGVEAADGGEESLQVRRVRREVARVHEAARKDEHFVHAGLVREARGERGRVGWLRAHDEDVPRAAEHAGVELGAVGADDAEAFEGLDFRGRRGCGDADERGEVAHRAARVVLQVPQEGMIHRIELHAAPWDVIWFNVCKGEAAWTTHAYRGLVKDVTTTTNPENTTRPTNTYRITGMTCGHCAQTVQRAAASVQGVESARVDFAARSLTVQGDVPAARIAEAVSEAGYGMEE